ncbi:putative farnesyl-diphosphate farnesyltransferase [Rhizodiscina lignyota]|uniref:Squalene synthase n=1 Tax=Rhizodiscina lignyota TaxID=1504668 RepID=A0A9P4IJZ0_9PEZI|nr:putative farnesyl-diphosphate farnesyltransferase [Rhizodiscina lignyota]
MGLASDSLYFALHPDQLWMIVQWKLQRRPIHGRNKKHESATAKICFDFLDETGRSFSSVVQELHPELLLPVCVFYLILRGLDTIEDDTSIPLETKEPLLRTFKENLEQDGWTFTGNRPEEKDRQLLVQFDNVVTEFKKLKPVYQAIIKDITDKMGNGMADFARKAAYGDISVNTVDEYDLYCWHVAGIVGEGLTHLFVEAGLGEATLIHYSHLYKSMGLLLQKNNIIRDIREDYDDGRCFWPKEIWSKHVDNFEDLFEPEKLELALNCSSEMVLNALGHASDCLSYLVGLREQSVFNFCAIPQSMAMATLELCFRNPALFERNIKITKGDAFQLMIESSQGIEGVCEVFCRYVYRIQQKNDPKDPNFLSINIACEQVEKFAEALAPQSIELAKGKTKWKALVADEERFQHQARFNEEIWSTTGRVLAILAVILILVLGAAWLMAARFNLA